ncbi:MAG: uroporphyrinogen-III synthase [Bacteroidales bacterium]|nr:uroporphyrinogen-III synthase [Bacteroidales bacterium]
MAAPLEGRVIALAEARHLEELTQMIVREGGTPLAVPMVAMLDSDEPGLVTAWMRDCVAGPFDYCVAMTGEGLRRLLSVAEREGIRAEFVAALGRMRVITRGSKPAGVLKELGFKPYQTATPPTTDGLIATLSREKLHGQTVGVVCHGNDNPPLIAAITQGGAVAVPVKPYRYAPASDADQVVDCIHQMAAGSVDLFIITSSSQVDRLFTVAKERGLSDQLATGLKQTAIAAVGPIAADSLLQQGVRVDICPDQGWVMKKLVQLACRELDTKKPR